MSIQALLVVMIFVLFSDNAQAYNMSLLSKLYAEDVSAVAYCGDNETAGAISRTNKTLSIINIKSGAITNKIKLPADPVGVAGHGSNSIVVATSKGFLYLYNFKTGEINGMIDSGANVWSVVSGGPNTLIIGGDGYVKTIDSTNGEVISTVSIPGIDVNIAVTAGYVIALSNIADGSALTVIDRKSNQSVTSRQSEDVISSMDIDESLGLVAITKVGGSKLYLLAVNSLLPIGDIELNQKITSVSVNPSTHVATATTDNGSIAVINLETKLVESLYPLFEKVMATNIDAANNIVAISMEKTLAFIKLENPVPVLARMIPEETLAGTPGLPLFLFGSKFTKDTRTLFNQKPADTIFGSNEFLKAKILPDELIYPGDVTVSAENPPPGGGISNILKFRILTPVPILSELRPAVIEVSKPAVIRIEGKNFLPNADVLIDGQKTKVYFVSSILLEATIDPAITNKTGSHKVVVANSGQITALSDSVDLVVSDKEAVKREAERNQSVNAANGKGSLQGTVLNTNKKPVVNATVSYKNFSTKTDSDGRFTLENIPEGRRTILIDGSTAVDEIGYYPSIPVTANIKAGTSNQMAFTPHLHHQKNHNFVKLDHKKETVVTDPEIKGFEMKIPKGVRVIGWDGKANEKVSVRTVPTDRLPIKSLPDNTNVRSVMMFFFNKVGGGRPDQPIPFRSINNLGLLPGEKTTLWYYDESSNDNEAPNDWAIAGTGTVSADGRYISTDTNVGIPKFCCGATAWSWGGGDITPAIGNLNQPDNSYGNTGTGPVPVQSAPSMAADPVNVSTGYFYREDTDMVVPGAIPVKINRYYWNKAGGSTVAGMDGTGFFGRGAYFEYDWRVDTYSNMIRLIKPGGFRCDFALQPDGSYINFSQPAYAGAKIVILGGLRVLKTRDGWSYTFEARGGLIELADRNGNKILITRTSTVADDGGYITKITTPEGLDINFTLFHLGYSYRVDSVTDPSGRMVNYTYETDQSSDLWLPRLKSVQYPDLSTLQYGYDSYGRMDRVTDAKGNIVISNVYDSNNRVVSQTQADGSTYTFEYTIAAGNVTQTVMTSPNGAQETWRFNEWGNATDYGTSDGTTTYQLDSESNHVSSATDPLGRITSYSYFQTSDARNGQVSSVTDPAGNTTSFDYEPILGLPSKITNALGKETSFTHTITGTTVAKTEVRDPLQNLTTIIYDSHGMPVSVADPNSNTTLLTYDADKHGQLSTVTDPLGNSVSYSYDTLGRVKTTTDSKNGVTSYTYDVMNRVTSVTDPMGFTTGYSYDLNGNLLSLTDPKGNITRWQYDNRDRVVQITDRRGKIETFAYYTGSEITPTTGDNLKSHTDKKGQTTIFDSYDAQGRVTHVTFADGSTIQYTYDLAGRPTSVVDSVSGTLAYTYDILNRVTQETTPLGSIGYSYDVIGRRTSMAANGSPTVNYTYDDAGRMTTVSRIVNGVLRNYSLGYDAAGRRSSLHTPLANGTDLVTSAYGFDAGSRLTSLSHQGPAGVIENFAYTYDNAGNKTTAASVAAQPTPAPINGTSYNNEYEMLSYNGKALTYDENGNLTSKTDNLGNITSYTWDVRNRLAGVTSPSYSASFSYDAFGRRISKTINGVTTQYAYDGADIIQEFGATQADYVRTLNVDEPLTKADGTNAYHYIRDGLGSVAALVDDTGATAASYTYDPYGVTTALGATANPFQFTGRENDGDLYFYRARYYSPEMQRFISRDPLQFSAGSPNFYGYVGQNPVNYTDPSGQILVPLLEAAAYVALTHGGAAIAAGVGLAIASNATEAVHKGKCSSGVGEATFGAWGMATVGGAASVPLAMAPMVAPIIAESGYVWAGMGSYTTAAGVSVRNGYGRDILEQFPGFIESRLPDPLNAPPNQISVGNIIGWLYGQIF